MTKIAPTSLIEGVFIFKIGKYFMHSEPTEFLYVVLDSAMQDQPTTENI